jgi:ferric-dicitrate binding protein FerR (iron transport regulator)
MKSLDRHSLEEQTRLVSRYVAGDLSRSERAEFEAWLVASPELAAEVEMERRLRRGMASAARRGWLKNGAQVQAGADRRWRMAVAASLVLALTTLGLSLVLPDRDGSSSGAGLAASIPMPHYSAPRTVRLGSVRGLGTSPDVTVARNDAPRELTIEPAVVVLTCEDGAIELECAGGGAPQTPQYDEYELELVNRRSAAVAWRSPRQVASSGTTLSFVIPDPAAFGSGDYDMVVRGHSPDHEEAVARFWLRVTER